MANARKSAAGPSESTGFGRATDHPSLQLSFSCHVNELKLMQILMLTNNTFKLIGSFLI